MVTAERLGLRKPTGNQRQQSATVAGKAAGGRTQYGDAVAAHAHWPHLMRKQLVQSFQHAPSTPWQRFPHPMPGCGAQAAAQHYVQLEQGHGCCTHLGVWLSASAEAAPGGDSAAAACSASHNAPWPSPAAPAPALQQQGGSGRGAPDASVFAQGAADRGRRPKLHLPCHLGKPQGSQK